jgi:hypothetical protein
MDLIGVLGQISHTIPILIYWTPDNKTNIIFKLKFHGTAFLEMVIGTLLVKKFATIYGI